MVDLERSRPESLEVCELGRDATMHCVELDYAVVEVVGSKHPVF